MRLGQQQVVAVAAGAAGKLAVVETEDADDPVGNRAHRDERADGQVARAEVRPRRAPAEPVGEQHPDVGELELGAASRDAVAGLGVDIAEQALQLAPLPGLALAGGGERVGGVGDRVDPPRDRFRFGERVGRRLHAVDELREPAGKVDRAAVDVVERQHALDEPAVVLGHRDADQHPVEAPPPRVGVERAELERLAVRSVEPPPDPALGDPLLHPRQVVVVEAESPADRVTPGQVEQL